MATEVILPRQGQSVETCLIVEWKKKVGDPVVEGEVICEVETDKATFEIEAPASGTLLAVFFPEGEDVPVLTTLAAIGEEGEDVAALRPAESAGGAAASATESASATAPSAAAEPVVASIAPESAAVAVDSAAVGGARHAASPRARKLAQSNAVDVTGLAGSGPKGRVIERDVQQVVASRPPLSSAARAAAAGGAVIPAVGSGVGGRAVLADMKQVATAVEPDAAETGAPVTEIKLTGIRKLIAGRMLESLQTTAQLTLNASASAVGLLALRQRLKAAPEDWGVNRITLNDLILFAVSRTLPRFAELNAHFEGEVIRQFAAVNLAFAVDTPRGLMVPVIQQAQTCGLQALSTRAGELARGCVEGGVSPDDLQGGTFTVTNLGAYGIETFTPVLNPPQVAILGVGKAVLRPVERDGEVVFEPQLALSLTINHQVVDGGPAARFLGELSRMLADIELCLCL